MSPQHTEPPPRNGTKTTALVALVAALLGGTGGLVITPRTNQSDAVSKDDLREALAPIAGELKELRADVTNLREEVAVARYAREHRNTP
jgi:hypothetical protein